MTAPRPPAQANGGSESAGPESPFHSATARNPDPPSPLSRPSGSSPALPHAPAPAPAPAAAAAGPAEMERLTAALRAAAVELDAARERLAGAQERRGPGDGYVMPAAAAVRAGGAGVGEAGGDGAGVIISSMSHRT